jgi:alanyl-tRNA synthetase
MTPDEAIAAGALALFGEKYGDEVRVVSMGVPSGDKADEGAYFSTELCGGTHVRRTGDIALFKIVSEGAVAAGVRRIEALTGQAALDYLNGQDKRVHDLAAGLKTTPADLADRVQTLVEERRKLEREVSDLRKKLATGGGGGDDDVREIGGVKIIARHMDGIPGKELKSMADGVKKRLGSGIVALVATDEGKAAIVVGVTDDLTGRFSAVDLVKAGVAELGGKGGGGRPDMAQGGGPDAARAAQAIKAIEAVLATA